jgi:hypothetical protein
MSKKLTGISKTPLYKILKNTCSKNLIKSYQGNLNKLQETSIFGTKRARDVYLYPFMRGLQRLCEEEESFNIKIDLNKRGDLKICLYVIGGEDEHERYHDAQVQYITLRFPKCLNLQTGEIIPALTERDLIEQRIRFDTPPQKNNVETWQEQVDDEYDEHYDDYMDY